MLKRWIGVALLLFMSISSLFAYSMPAYAAPSATPTPDPSNGATCDAGAMTWAICPIISGIADLVDGIMKDIIQPFLQVSPLTQTVKNSSGATITNPTYTIWQNFRNVASVMMILVFFAIIFGTAIGFDNYTIKKTMPHLIAGAILIPFSWYICVIMVDAGNVLGQGILALVDSFVPKPQIDFSTSLSTLMGLGGGVVAVIALKNAGADMGIAVLITILLAVLATLFTLVLRQIIIILLVVLSPFAFLMFILPNTQKIFTQWWQNLSRLILMYPLVMLLFEAGRIFAVTAGSTFSTAAGGTTDYLKSSAVPFLQLAGLFLPLAAVPWTYKWAGGAMTMGAKAVSSASGAMNKRYGRGSDFDKKRREKAQERGSASYVGKPISKLGRAMQSRYAEDQLDDKGNVLHKKGELKHKGLAGMSQMGGSYRAGQGLGVRTAWDKDSKTKLRLKTSGQNAHQKAAMESTYAKAVQTETSTSAAERLREAQIASGSFKGFHDTINTEADRAVADQQTKARAAQASVYTQQSVGLERMKNIALGHDKEFTGATAREAAIMQLGGGLDEGNFLREHAANGNISPELMKRGTADLKDFVSKNRDIALSLDKHNGANLMGAVYTAPAGAESADEVLRVAGRQAEFKDRKPSHMLSMGKETQREYVDRAYTLKRQEEVLEEKERTSPGSFTKELQDVKDARAKHTQEIINAVVGNINDGTAGQLDQVSLNAVRDGQFKIKYKTVDPKTGKEVELETTHDLGLSADQKKYVGKFFDEGGVARRAAQVTPMRWAAPEEMAGEPGYVPPPPTTTPPPTP